MIKTDLSVSVITMHLDTWEQYVHSRGHRECLHVPSCIEPITNIQTWCYPSRHYWTDFIDADNSITTTEMIQYTKEDFQWLCMWAFQTTKRQRLIWPAKWQLCHAFNHIRNILCAGVFDIMRYHRLIDIWYFPLKYFFASYELFSFLIQTRAW